jgi:hypothetical protein
MSNLGEHDRFQMDVRLSELLALTCKELDDENTSKWNHQSLTREQTRLMNQLVKLRSESELDVCKWEDMEGVSGMAMTECESEGDIEDGVPNFCHNCGRPIN